MKINKFLSVAAAAMVCAGCVNQTEVELREIIDNTVERYKPSMVEANIAYWNGAVSGNEGDFAKYVK